MAKSYVDKVTDTMHQLLWDNILEELVKVSLPALPGVGPFFANPIVNSIVRWAIDEFLFEPLLKLLTRWGVFTSINWQNAEIYAAYEKEAIKLVGLQDKDVWSPEDEKAFTDAARKLIVFNIRK